MTDSRDNLIAELRAMIRDGHVSALSDEERRAFELRLLSMIEEAASEQRQLANRYEKAVERLNALDAMAGQLETSQGSINKAARQLGATSRKCRLPLN